MKCPDCSKGTMEIGYAIKSDNGCCRIAPLDMTVDYDHFEFDIVYKCTECGYTENMNKTDKKDYINFLSKRKKHYAEFLEKKDELKESLAEDFTLALKQMKVEDIRKLTWFPGWNREV